MAGEEFVIPGTEAGGAAVADPPETPVEEVPEGAAPETTEGEQPETPETPEGEQPDAELSSIETDGRKLEGKAREVAARIAKIDKAAAKDYRENHYRVQSVIKEVPEAKTFGEAVTAIRNMRATIDELGGETGITELRTEVDDYRAEVKQFGDGDPALIKTLGESNPEGLARQGTNTLEWLKTNKPELYENTIRPTFLEHAEKVGVNNLIRRLLPLVHDGKGQESYDLLLGADKWFKDESAKVDATKAAPAKNPEVEKLAKDREDFETQKRDDFIKRVDADVNRSNDPELDKFLNPLQKELGLQKPGMQHFRNGLIQRVWSTLAKDPAYIKNVRAIKAKGDSVKTAEYIHQAFAERLPEQFRLHRNEIYPNIGSAKKPAPAANGNGKEATKKVINVVQGQRPRREDVDWSKTPDVMWISGRAVLTNGKTVSGFKDAPANRL